jgi:hypothetical protein
MSLTLEDIHKIRAGWLDLIQVAELPSSILESIGWMCPRVYFGKRSLDHIAEGHEDVTDYDLLRIPAAIKLGMMVLDERNGDYLEIGYQTENPNIRFRCTLRTFSDTEVYVWTFHRTRRKQSRAMLRRGRLIRTHQ